MAKKASNSYDEAEDEYDVPEFDETMDLDYYEQFMSKKNKNRTKKRKTVKHRLDDYFERKALKERNGYYDEYDY